MRLLVDIGNSRVKWARETGDGLHVGESFATAEIAIELPRLWAGLEVPTSLHGACVAGPEPAEQIADWALRRWSVTVRWVATQAVGHGVRNGYRLPETLGVDRWINLVAVRNEFPLPACVVSCGTAVTLDALDAQGRHLGGMLLPGFALMAGALAVGTHAVRAGRVACPSLFGDSTSACFSAGFRGAARGMIETACADWQARMGEPIQLVLTGGDASAVAEVLTLPHRVVPDLLLRGLSFIARFDK